MAHATETESYLIPDWMQISAPIVGVMLMGYPFVSDALDLNYLELRTAGFFGGLAPLFFAGTVAAYRLNAWRMIVAFGGVTILSAGIAISQLLQAF